MYSTVLILREYVTLTQANQQSPSTLWPIVLFTCVDKNFGSVGKPLSYTAIQ